MDRKIDINNPADIDILRKSESSQSFLLSGRLYTARDAAHKRLKEMVERGERLPIDFREKIIYYMGPSPKRPGNPIGSCGPTSSYRMDPFTELSFELGVIATIGKGERDPSVTGLIRKYRAPYLITIGGAAAYLAACVTSARTVLFEDLGAEAVNELVIKDFPAITAIDIHGGSIFSPAAVRAPGTIKK